MIPIYPGGVHIRDLTPASCLLTQEKKEEIWLSPMTKAPTPTEKSKKHRDNTKKNRHQNVDYATGADLEGVRVGGGGDPDPMEFSGGGPQTPLFHRVLTIFWKKEVHVHTNSLIQKYLFNPVIDPLCPFSSPFFFWNLRSEVWDPPPPPPWKNFLDPRLHDKGCGPT